MRPRIPQWPLLPMMMLGLAGCAEFEARKGPDPVINGAAVQTTSSNKTAIINALAVDAGYRPGDPVDYYQVAEAGFNYVDDQCRSYFDNLFFLQRRREELKSGLAASAATTGTILSITNAAVPTLGIVAAAFGLASNATDIVAGTYLFALPPATTQGFVEKLQLAYRAEAANNRALINSPTSAYYQIQRYLNLCLPPTIEAEITRQISSTRAIPVSSGPGPFFSVESVGPAVTTLPKLGGGRLGFRLGGAAPGEGPSGPANVRPHVRPAGEPPETLLPRVFGLPNSITPSEKQMRADELGHIQQNVLCVGETRSFDKPTRAGIRIFQSASNLDETGQIEVSDRNALIKEVRRGPCPPDAQNYFERVTFFSKGGKLDSALVSELQALLKKRPEGQAIRETGQLDIATRQTIAAVRRGMTNLKDVPSASQQVTQPFFNELSQ